MSAYLLLQVNATNGEHESALFESAKENNMEAFNRLLAAGSSPTCIATYGASILHITAYHGQTSLLPLLIQAGLSPNTLNSYVAVLRMRRTVSVLFLHP